MVKSIMLYGCEIWRLIEKTKRALEATDDFRRFMRISQRKKMRNEEIKQRIEIEVLIIDYIKRERLVRIYAKNGRKLTAETNNRMKLLGR